MTILQYYNKPLTPTHAIEQLFVLASTSTLETICVLNITVDVISLLQNLNLSMTSHEHIPITKRSAK